MVPSTAIRLPNHRWQIYPQKPELAQQLAEAVALPPILAQALIDRGIETVEEVKAFLDPESVILPSPVDDFPDLALTVELLEKAIAKGSKIAICGDYDADGMTSTALLMRALRALGANVDYAIPSRMAEGYGINERIVREFHGEGVQIILTVDNGIAAVKPITLARELGMDAIITDHHELPDELPPATAILNPKLIREESPYRGVAGVGVAYILAICLAQKLGQSQPLIKPLRELLTLGTIADLAPLTGVNRRWVKRGLRQLPESELAGIQALIQVSGASSSGGKSGKTMKPDEIGFRLGPRINAVGRIGDPQIAIELLTTDDQGIALTRAMQCEQLNQDRQQMCETIEGEAVAWIESSGMDYLGSRVLVVVQPGWHHGTIGIVASRLVERYGVPVFIGTYEDETQDKIRGSARSIPEFHVFEAMQHCDRWLGKYGGHRAAGGFTLSAQNLDGLRQGLSEFAHGCLEPHHLKPAIAINVLAEFEQIDLDLYREIDRLHPCGIENPSPVFWTPNVEVVEQRIVGKGHIKLTLESSIHSFHPDSPKIATPRRIQGIAWRWGDYFPLPRYIDVAYKLRENTWNGNTNVELELISARLPENEESRPSGSTQQSVAPQPPVRRSLKTPQKQAVQESLPRTTPGVTAPRVTPVIPPAPAVTVNPEWLSGIPLQSLLPHLQGRVLFYGAGKPEIGATACEIEWNVPKRPCDTLLLWTLPPSGTHLQWLLAKGMPRQVYVYNHLPPLPSPMQVRSHLRDRLQELGTQPLNLLQLGQELWVAPSTLLAALRELGDSYPEFPPTQTLDRELERLYRWYAFPPGKLAQINWRSPLH